MVQFSHNGLSKLDSVFSPIQTIRQLSVDTTPHYWDKTLGTMGNMITQWQGGQGGVTGVSRNKVIFNCYNIQYIDPQNLNITAVDIHLDKETRQTQNLS